MDGDMQITPAGDGPTLAHIAQRVIGQPLLLHPAKADVIVQVLGGRIGIANTGKLPPEADSFTGSYRRQDRDRGLSRISDGVAVISIVGSLVNRGAWIGAYSGLVSYEGIAAQVRDAVADDEVHSIILDIDSPGGEALGAFALADVIRDARTTKRVVAVVNDMAASAGYAIASAADEVVVSNSSVVGSIGVIMLRMDRTEQFANEGIKTYVFSAGKYKTDGHPLTEMSEAEALRFGTEIQQFYDLFVGSVVAGRGGRITEEQVRKTEAGIYIGKTSIEAGLADRVGSFSSVLRELQEARGADFNPNGGSEMSTKTTGPDAAAQGNTMTHSQADVDAARTEGRAEGAAQERARCKGIQTCDEAEGREAQARAIAFETDMTVEQAQAFLTASPKAEASGYKTIEQRAKGEAEMGADASEGTTPEANIDAAWGAAVKRAAH